MKYCFIPLLFFAVHLTGASTSFDTGCFDYAVNPPITCPSECLKIIADAEFLVFKPQMENHFYGTAISQSPFVNGMVGVSEVKRKHFTYRWDAGFRIGIGIGVPIDQWGLEATWTYFSTDTHNVDQSDGFAREGQEPLGVYFEAGMDHINSVENLFNNLRTEANWKLNFNQIDLFFFREFIVGSALSVKPSFGLRALFIGQKMHVLAYQNLEKRTFYDGKWSTYFKSLGLFAGFETFWDFGYSTGVFGHATVGAVLGDHVGSHGVLFDNDLVFSTSDVHMPSTSAAVKGIVDLGVGLEWRCATNCDMHLLFFRIGYEYHLYLDQNFFTGLETNIISIPRVLNFDGNLSLWGLTIRSGFKF